MNMDEKVTFGLKRRVAYLIIWLTSWLGGLVFFVSEKEDRGVRKTALQSIFLGGVLLSVNAIAWILGFIPIVNVVAGILSTLVFWAYWVIVIILAVGSYQGTEIHLPIIGDAAERYI